METDLSLFAQALALFLLTFVSEDAATLAGSVLALPAMEATAQGHASIPLIGPGVAIGACFLGIWLGDIGLYGLGRWLGGTIRQTAWIQRWVPAGQWERSQRWFERHGLWALVLSRFLPGTRLATYTIAGAVRMPVLTFALLTGVMSTVWLIAIFGLVRLAGPALVQAWLMSVKGGVWNLLIAGVVTLGLLGITYWISKSWRLWIRSASAQRWIQWEFWPAWLFYIPVAVHYVRLSLKYGGLNLPTCANPGIETGGFIGESKALILRNLRENSPQFTAVTALIPEGTPMSRMATLAHHLAEEGLEFPVVMKPDVAQRGCGFKVVRTPDDAIRYLMAVESAVVLQEYIPGPYEVGIFYYRMPDEPCGRIFAITEKVFPVIYGDGARTVAQLIRDDERAAIMADVYLRRLHKRRDEVPAPGQSLRLVEAGNHAQGCIFRDGMHLWSEQLEARIDQISQAMPGFFIGRYDIRYKDPAELKNGRGFQILELNGASSEATSIYDARRTLWEAYRTLFQQWDLVFAIGAQNRERGCRPDTALSLVREWLAYQRRSSSYPQAD